MSLFNKLLKNPFVCPTRKAFTLHVNIKNFTPRQFNNLKTYINTFENNKDVNYIELSMDKSLQQDGVSTWDETKLSLKLNTVQTIKDFINNNYKEDDNN